MFNKGDAKESFETQLAAKAAQQYLINQSVVSGGYIYYMQNNTATARQQYLTSLTTNGLSGSGGWPQHVKRIAVANASDVGVKNGVLGEEALYIKRKTAWVIRAVELQAFLQNDFNVLNDPIHKARLFVFSGLTGVEISLKNLNPPGSLDILPGRLTNSTQIIFDGLLKGISEHKTKIIVKETRVKPKHTFMPVISTLAFNNTNIDWGQVLNNRNLVCTGEIPFDAYKISGTNQDHITITEDIYNWLEYQFLYGDAGCDPICGSYSITGDQSICDGNTSTVHTYTFTGGIGTGQTLQWSVSGDLVIDNTSGNTAGIKITSTDGSGMLTATLINNCGDKVVTDFQVQVGKPDIYLTSALDEDDCKFIVTINTTPADKIPLSYQWSTNGTTNTNGSVSKEYWLPPHHTSMAVYARADWGCGYTADDISLSFPQQSKCAELLPAPLSNHSEIDSQVGYLLSPNPTSSGWQLTLPKTITKEFNITLYDINHRLISKYKYMPTNASIRINGEHLKPGLYFINIANSKNNVTLKAIKLGDDN